MLFQTSHVCSEGRDSVTSKSPGTRGFRKLEFERHVKFLFTLDVTFSVKMPRQQKNGRQSYAESKKKCIFTMEHTNKYGRFSQKIQVLQLPLIIQGN